MLFIDELNIRKVSFIKNYPHYCLSRSYRAVNFGMNLINANRISLSNKCVEDVFTKLLAFNNYLFANGVNFIVKNCQSIDSISFLCYS